jgi:hypothetical protein
MNNNNIVVDFDDLKFEHPSNWIIGATSQSGKSYLVYQSSIKFYIVTLNGNRYVKI